MTEQEDMASIIKNILEEDTNTSKFESTDQMTSVDKKVGTSKNQEKTAKKSKELVASKGPKKSQSYQQTKPAKKMPTTKKPMNQKEMKAVAKSKSIGDIIVNGLRYVLAGLIVLFTISLFFDWISLSGNAINQGMLRSDEVKPFLQEGIREHSVTSLESYEGPIVTFSAMDMYYFSNAIGDQYKTVIGPSGKDSTSLVSMIQKYYMKAVILLIVVNVVSLLMVLAIPSLKGISTVRNLSVLNFVIIGLNYLTLKVPYFSMFAVKAKDTLSQTIEYPEIAITHNGITLNQSFYPYNVYEERGFVFALVVLGLWLVVGIILAEVKSRRDEIAIEKGEI